MPADDPWSPRRYDRFRNERGRPFHDLLELVQRRPMPPGARALDLGCGTGELTGELHAALGCGLTVGVDESAAMLARAPERRARGLHLVRGRIEDLPVAGAFDLVFSNAALHWIDDHEPLLARLVEHVAPGGRLAVQVPANHGHPAWAVATALAGEEPFRAALGGYTRRSPVLEPEAYALVLDRLGFGALRVRLEVYLHRLPDRDAVADWMRGTTLTAYERRLDAATYEAFVAAYRRRLAEALPDERPFPFPFRRILLCGVREG